ncbi:MAG TPA: DinB family protein [Blastocatellia bacterium]
MTETERIKDQLKRAFEGEAWHGPSVKEVLAGLDAQTATRKPIPNAHSIMELVHHMAGWADVVRQRIDGHIVKEPAAGNFPRMAVANPENWNSSLEWLESTYNELQAAVAGLSELRLDEPVASGSKSTIYGNLHGTIQHYLYHAGQIALLRKAGS